MSSGRGRASKTGARNGNGTPRDANGQTINKWAVATQAIELDSFHGPDFWKSYKVNDRFWIVKEADEHYWYAEKEGAHSLKSKKVSKSDVEFEQSDGESNGAAKRGAADAPATEMRKKSKTEVAPVVDDELKVEGAKSPLEAAALHHMQSEANVSSGGGGSAATESGTRGKVPHVTDQGMIDITDRYALLIGNSDYQGTLRDGVSWCAKDAEDMARQLACNTLGVYKFTTMVLVNKTKQEIENSIREWARGLPHQCVALVMFSGHALEAHGKNYLVPVDAPENMLEAEIEYKCISLDWIMACILQQLDRESLIIALLDCCREETFTRGLRTGGTGKRGLGPVNLSDPENPAVFVGYAAAPGMCAMERHQRRNGNFTRALLFALKDHEISRQDIRSGFFGAVVENVMKNESRPQRPHMEVNMTKGFAFRPRASISATSAEVQQDACEQEMNIEAVLSNSNVAAGGGGRSKHSEKAEQLAQMGFDKARALEILDIVDGNVDLALDMLS